MQKVERMFRLENSAVSGLTDQEREERIVEPMESVGPGISKRQRPHRYQLLTRVDVSVTGGHDTYWGGLVNVSPTGVTLLIKQPLKPQQQVTICFLFQSEEGKTTTEVLNARVIWRSGDNTGVQFETPLTTGSQARKIVPLLAASLTMKEKK